MVSIASLWKLAASTLQASLSKAWCVPGLCDHAAPPVSPLTGMLAAARKNKMYWSLQCLLSLIIFIGNQCQRHEHMPLEINNNTHSNLAL